MKILNRFIRLGVISLLAMGITLGTTGFGSAHAAPMGCAGPDAPPACIHTPTPPASPPSLETAPFSLYANAENEIDVEITDLGHPESLDGYRYGATTRFWMSISCTSGYFYRAPMTVYAVGFLGTPALHLHTSIPASTAPDSCRATTWDQLTLGLSTSYAGAWAPTPTPSGTLRTTWRIDFRP